MRKSIISIAVVSVVCILLVLTSVVSLGLSFTDVSQSDWFYDDVRIAVEKELVNGKSDTIYAPNDKLTFAETVKLAACMNQKYTSGSVTLKNGNPWYITYVEYCENHNIINIDYKWNEIVSRAEYMDIFSRALPDSALGAVNTVLENSIPDVPNSHEHAKPIYKLYRAGIVNGVDAARNCKPDANITRAEVAAILTRMMDASKRIKFTLGEKSDELKIPEQLTDADINLNPDLLNPDLKNIIIKPKIMTQPKSVNAVPGSKTGMRVEAIGEELTYKWLMYDNIDTFVDISESTTFEGAKTKMLIFDVTTKYPEKATFKCLITDKYGNSVESDVAVLTVNLDITPKAYVKSIRFITTVDEKELDYLTSEAEIRGEVVIKKDLNKGAKGAYIYLVYRTTDNAEDAVKDLFVQMYDSPNVGEGWTTLEHFGTSKWLKDKTNLNEGTKGKPIYLSQTWDQGQYRAPITALKVYFGKNPKTYNLENVGWEVVNFVNSSTEADLNKEAGGEYIYLLMQRKFK